MTVDLFELVGSPEEMEVRSAVQWMLYMGSFGSTVMTTIVLLAMRGVAEA